jgi:hypothetical protein
MKGEYIDNKLQGKVSRKFNPFCAKSSIWSEKSGHDNRTIEPSEKRQARHVRHIGLQCCNKLTTFNIALALKCLCVNKSNSSHKKIFYVFCQSLV